MKPSPSGLTIRRLGHPQMAFVRSWAEGLDLVAAWDRYLYVDGQGDGRRARGELQRLLDELRSLAREHGRPDLAALLRRDPEAIPDEGANVPTLDEFAAQQPADYYTEAELIALSDATREAIERSVHDVLERQRERARQIVRQSEAQLLALRDLLLEKKVLDREAFGPVLAKSDAASKKEGGDA